MAPYDLSPALDRAAEVCSLSELTQITIKMRMPGFAYLRNLAFLVITTQPSQIGTEDNHFNINYLSHFCSNIFYFVFRIDNQLIMLLRNRCQFSYRRNLNLQKHQKNCTDNYQKLFEEIYKILKLLCVKKLILVELLH